MISLKSLTKRYGSSLVLDGLDFEVSAREIAAVVGPSGAGKSTLARCITLLEQPTSGRVVVDGQDLTSLRQAELRRARRSIGTVFQSANLLNRLTVAQNVALPLESTSLDERARYLRVRDLLDRVGLLNRASHYPAQLSGGQRQRVGIARSLVLEPSVLLADEATSGLDPDATASILRLVIELRDELGLTVVLITHEMDVVRMIADTVAHLDHGRIVEQGPVAEVVRNSDSSLSRALLPLPAAAATRPHEDVWTVRYAEHAADPGWVGAVSRRLGSDITLLAALIEQVGGDTVGRATVGIGRHHDPRTVVEAFTTCGLVAERSGADAVQALDMPSVALTTETAA